MVCWKAALEDLAQDLYWQTLDWTWTVPVRIFVSIDGIHPTESALTGFPGSRTSSQGRQTGLSVVARFGSCGTVDMPWLVIVEAYEGLEMVVV